MDHLILAHMGHAHFHIRSYLAMKSKKIVSANWDMMGVYIRVFWPEKSIGDHIFTIQNLFLGQIGSIGPIWAHFGPTEG